MNLFLSFMKKKIGLWAILASLSLSACTTLSELSGIGAQEIIPEVTAKRYAEHKATHGIVLLDAKWGRHWKCSGFENVQLRAFGFDRMPLSKRADDEPADVLLAHHSSMLSARMQSFQPYALLLEPGVYALSGFLIRAAASRADIRYFPTGRSVLFRNDIAHGGTFTVAAGETVYIGNFFVDCTLNTPILWRYYTEETHWPSHLREYKAKYPFLDLTDIDYRLFDTDVYGHPGMAGE